MQQANRIGLGVTVAMHVLAVAALLSYEPARQALLAAAPIMVDLIAPPKVEPPQPKPPTELPKPKPVVKLVQRPIEPPPILTAPAEAPSPIIAPPPPPPAPAPPIQQAPAPLVMTEPIYNADYLSNPAPIYPSVSRRMGEQGKVILRVLVNIKGTADDVQVRTSSGFGRLDDAARDTVRRWKFVPAKRGPDPVAAWVLIPVSFRLES
jgi:periplasmic protein TonB